MSEFTVKLTNQRYSTVLYLVDSVGVLYRSMDGAQSWAAISNMPAGSFAAADVVEQVWQTPMVGLHASAAGLHRTVNGGLTWTLQQAGTFYGLSMHDGMRGYCVGTSASLYKTIDGGATWAAVGSLGVGTTKLNAVSCVPGSATIAYAVGDVYGAKGVILKTTDGTSWALQDSGVNTSFSAVATAADGLHVVVGQTGSAEGRYTANGAAPWTATSGLIGEVYAISLSGPTFIAASVVAPGLFQSTDSGGHWSACPVTGAMGYALAFISASTGWAVTDTAAWMTNKAGASWSQMPKPGAAPVTLAVVTGYVSSGPSLMLDVA